LKRSVSASGVGHEHLFDAGPRQLDEVHDGALGDPYSVGGMRQHEHLRELAKNGVGRE
jgi:hypothetical protein